MTDQQLKNEIAMLTKLLERHSKTCDRVEAEMLWVEAQAVSTQIEKRKRGRPTLMPESMR